MVQDSSFLTQTANSANFHAFAASGAPTTSAAREAGNSDVLSSGNALAAEMSALLDQTAQALKVAGITEADLLDEIPIVRAEILAENSSPEFLARLHAAWQKLHPED